MTKRKPAKSPAQETTAISDTRQAAITREALEWIKSHSAPFLLLDIAAEPRPESLRAGVRGGRAYVYKGKLYAEFLQAALVQVAEQKPEVPVSGDLVCFMEVICTKPRNTKRSRPNGDVDNLAKGVMDAMTQGGIYDDDDSLVSLTVVKRWAEEGENAGVKVALGKLKEI